jgi:transposase InsO family protein
VGAELWINKEAVRSITGWSDRTIRWKAQLGVLSSRNVSNQEKRGRGSREYALSSLPVEAQLKFLKQPLLSGPDCTALALRSDLNQSNLFASLPEVSEPERLNFSARQNAQALKRLEAIAPLVEFRSRSRSQRSRPTFRTIAGVAVRSMNSLASFLADQHHVSPRTLWNWYAQYRKLGYAGLVDRVRSDKGKSRFLKAHPAVRAFIENKYLGERLSIRLVYQALLRDLRNLEPDCTRPPSYSAVRSYLQQLPKPLLILSREGKRQFQERCEPYLLTDFESLVPNQIWVSDHGQHDVWVRNDLFSGVSSNAAVRPWLTAMIDMRSRKIVGTAWSATPSSHTISSALRVGIESFGISQILYVDNGKDYEKVGRIDFPPECSGVLVRLGIQPQYCLPRHPQSKLIESWFGTVRKRFDCLWPSYCGAGPKDRPEQCMAALKEHLNERYGDFAPTNRQTRCNSGGYVRPNFLPCKTLPRTSDSPNVARERLRRAYRRTVQRARCWLLLTANHWDRIRDKRSWGLSAPNPKRPIEGASVHHSTKQVALEVRICNAARTTSIAVPDVVRFR